MIKLKIKFQRMLLTANIEKTFQVDIHNRIKKLIEELESKAIEREILARLLVLTIVSKSHIFLIGEPGVGKTYLIKKVLFAISNARFFEYLMSQSTEAKEVLGVPYQGDNGQILYNTKDSMVDSHFVFLDEGLKARSSISNAMLGIMSQDRTFHMRGEGRGAVKTDLMSLFLASNEFPADSTMDAYDDRLHIRYEPLRIRKTENFKRYMRGDYDKTNNFTVNIDKEEINSICTLSEDISLPSHIEDILIVIKDLLIKQRSKASDRKIDDSLRIMRVSAYCNGRNALDVSDVLLLMHLSWRNFDDRDRVKEICYNSLFRSKNYFEAEIEKFDQMAQQQLNFVKNELEPILQKQIKMEPVTISKELARYTPPIHDTHRNLLAIEKRLLEILDYFETIKEMESLTRNNIFHIDLLKEEEMMVPKPYMRSFDIKMIGDIETVIVALRQGGSILQEFLSTCVDVTSYMEYTPKKVRHQ